VENGDLGEALGRGVVVAFTHLNHTNACGVPGSPEE